MPAEPLQSFPWQSLRVIFNGTSSIDTPQLELKSETEAHQFLLAYGFDWHKPSHVDRLMSLFNEACEFIENILLGGQKIPAEISRGQGEADLRRLLLFASRVQLPDVEVPESTLRRRGSWACAILRVMHTLLHLESDLRIKYLDKIKKQTLERFDAHVQKQGEKLFLGFERDKVPLVSFEKKEAKIKESILLKLLHKAENVAQEVYDHLGVRFVTERRVDAFSVVKYLVDHYLISVPNVMPSRCKNSLVDLSQFWTLLESEKTAGKELTEDSLSDIEQRLPFPGADATNPFSSTYYRALQFTCRPLIRIQVVRKGVKSEMNFFFPLEIQILDQESFKISQSSDAEHFVYKQKQLKAVQARVLSGIEDLP